MPEAMPRRGFVPTGYSNLGRTLARGDDNMTIVDTRWSDLPVPDSVDVLDGVPKERRHDPDSYALESELLWDIEF